jgi:hypothetical protein
MSYSGGGTLSAKADGVDRLQAGDMVEAEDLDMQIGQTCKRSATIRGGTRADILDRRMVTVGEHVYLIGSRRRRADELLFGS